MNAFETAIRREVANSHHPVMAKFLLRHIDNSVPQDRRDAAWRHFEAHGRIHTYGPDNAAADWTGADWGKILLTVLQLLAAVLPFVLMVL